MSVNDFNLAFCGLATAAVGIGYVCGRRLSGSKSPRPAGLHEKKALQDLEAGPLDSGASVGQKRKRMDHDFDEVKSDLGYPHNLTQIYPHKRKRTPTPPPVLETYSTVKDLLVAQQEGTRISDRVHEEAHAGPEANASSSDEVVSPVQTASEAVPEEVIAPSMPHVDAQSTDLRRPDDVAQAAVQNQVTKADCAPSTELEVKKTTQGDTSSSERASDGTSNEQPATSTAQKGETHEKAHAAASAATPATETSMKAAAEPTPASQASALAKPASATKPAPPSPQGSSAARPKTPETPKPTPARRGFAAFAGSASPFATLSTPKGGSGSVPVWASPNAAADNCSPPAWVSPTSSAWANRETGSPSVKEPVALVPQVYAAPVAQSHSTGEEDEEPTSEIRGVRLYTKHGAKGFSDGVVGTMKVLRHKETQKQRLLFRRDPLWQVTMNVRVQENMRCAYDAQERVVRIVARHLSDEGVPEIVVYAMKPTRACPKDKFAKFGEELAAVIGGSSAT
ncbi:hypothetical protein HDZ31DRAFT_67455 [Schizophyllum fasciatum]